MERRCSSKEEQGGSDGTEGREVLFETSNLSAAVGGNFGGGRRRSGRFMNGETRAIACLAPLPVRVGHIRVRYPATLLPTPLPHTHTHNSSLFYYGGFAVGFRGANGQAPIS